MKTGLICLITLIFHLLILWFLYSPYNELGIIKDFKVEIDSLTKINDSLYLDIKENKCIIEKYTQELNELENKKQTIIIKYKTKENEITHYTNNSLISEFDSIFSKHSN